MSDWNADVLTGIKRATGIIQGNITSNDSTATAIKSSSTLIAWVQLQNRGTKRVFYGGSDVLATGENAGPNMTQRGQTDILPIRDLTDLFVITDTGGGDQTIAWIAGTN